MTSERMHPIEIKGHLQKIGLIVQVASTIPCEDLLRAFSLNDALGLIIDPTSWMAFTDNAKKNERCVRALATFLKVCREEWPEMFESKGV